MDRIGGFEKQPTVAVAVSGGADSMALAVLANRWVRRRRGKLVALTVDHGLRKGSRAEAQEAQQRLRRIGMDGHLLVWRGDKPETGIQAAARDARYGLMAQWCRRHGVLHLLVAHHREDQAETVLHRLARSSGPDGLAGMAAINEQPDIRLLRPCLECPRDRLRAVLAKYKMSWSEDPSNQDDNYARVRLRKLLPALAAEGISPEALSGTARRMAGIRSGLENETARFLGTHAAIFPEGYATLDRSAFAEADPEISRRCLRALSTTMGGTVYPPRQASLEALCRDMRGGVRGAQRWRAKTLNGCRIMATGTDFLICREEGRCERVAGALPGASILWDNRFLVRLPNSASAADPVYGIESLGERGWAAIRREISPDRRDLVPRAALYALPALYIGKNLVAVPHVEFYKDASVGDSDVRFIPSKSVTSAGFSVV